MSANKNITTIFGKPCGEAVFLSNNVPISPTDFPMVKAARQITSKLTYLAAEEKRYQAPAVQRFREFVLET